MMEKLWFWGGGAVVVGVLGAAMGEVYIHAPIAFSWACLVAASALLVGARIGMAMWKPLADKAIALGGEHISLLEEAAKHMRAMRIENDRLQGEIARLKAERGAFR